MITRDEWLYAFGEAAMPNPDALTCAELAAMYGFSRRTMQERLAGMVRQGTVRRVVTVRNDRRQAGYLLVKGKKR